jgi:signal transduction histidine kinase
MSLGTPSPITKTSGRFVLKVSSLIAAPRPPVAALLQWATLTVALTALAGLLTGAVEPQLARLMALALAPLLGFEILSPSSPFRPAQTAAATALGAGSAVAVFLVGASGPAVVLQLVICAAGLLVVAAAALQLRAVSRQLDDAEHRVTAMRARATDAEGVTLRLGGVAHDINNLLTVVSGSAEMLSLRQPLPPAASRDAERLGRAAEKAILLGNELLAATRQQAMLPAPVNFNGVLIELGPILEQIARESQLQLVPQPAPLVVSMPPGTAEQILLNLVSNAAHAKARLISVRLQHSRGDVVVEVRDDGMGMDPATLKRAREPFFTTRPGRSGTGMGLYTVHEIAQAAGGSVQIRSRPGEGTQVSVRIPKMG